MLRPLFYFFIFLSSTGLHAAVPLQILDCLKQGNYIVQEEIPLYAQGFRIFNGTDFSFIEIKKGYGTKNEEELFLLSNGSVTCKKIKTLRPPFKRVLSLSTTFIPLFELGKSMNSLVGISGKKFINSSWAIEKLKTGLIKDIGHPPNLESIAHLKADLILIYPLAEQEFSLEEKFKALKLNYLNLAEYLEPHPLGRAEWVKVFCKVIECRVNINDEFAKIAKNYETTKVLAQKSRTKPKIMMGSFWGGDWHSPGGDSYLAKLVADAGGEYVFSDPKTSHTKVMDFEFVYSVFSGVDIWLPHISMGDLTTLQLEDPRYKMLKKFPLKIFNYDKIRSESGGIDFWENGVYRPDLVLSDLMQIFHPELASGQSLVWYRGLMW